MKIKNLPLMPGLVSMILLSGCAHNLPVIAYDKSANPVHSITLVTPYVLDQPTLIQGELNTVEDTPMVGGALAALVIGGVEMHRQDKLGNMIQTQGFSGEDILSADITNALTAKGYTVTSVGAPRPDMNFLTTYPAAQTDAYLDVVVSSYGYSQGGFSAYQPILAAQYKLVRASDNQIIMQGTVAYSGSTTAYSFGSYGAFGADPQRTVAGLKEEMSEVAMAVANGLN
jgi:hypothetical protein